MPDDKRDVDPWWLEKSMFPHRCPGNWLTRGRHWKDVDEPHPTIDWVRRSALYNRFAAWHYKREAQ